MTPERFRQIEELYHSARQRTGEERAALLGETDPELRREIEALLAQPDSGEFLDRPALENAAELGDSTLTALEEWRQPPRLARRRQDRRPDRDRWRPSRAATKVKMVFIDGKPVTLDTRQKQLYEKYSARQ